MQNNDIGTLFELTCFDSETGLPLDISTADTKMFVFKKPSGDILNVSASFATDGTDGKLQYLTLSGNIDEAGTWTFQAAVTFTDGAAWRSPVVKFTVLANVS